MGRASKIYIAVSLVTVLTVEAQVRSIYWVEENQAVFRLVSGSIVKDEVVSDLGYVAAVDVDSISGKLYWLDLFGEGSNLFRADLDGQNVEPILLAECGIGAPTDIAIDSPEAQIYWGIASDCQGVIDRSYLDGTGVERVIGGAFPFEPQRIALDTEAKMVYWTDSFVVMDRDGNVVRDAAIARADWGGSDMDVIAEFRPADIALDLGAKKLYWVETDPVDGGVVRRSDLDGAVAETVLEGLDQPVDLALDVDKGWMYWVERGAGAIRRARLDGTDVQDVITQLTEPSRLTLSFENSGVSVGVAPRERGHSGAARLDIFPNPSTAPVQLSVRVYESTFVNLQVYDVLGRSVSVVYSDVMRPGVGRLTWNPSTKPPGTYIIALRAGETTVTRKVVFRR